MRFFRGLGILACLGAAALSLPGCTSADVAKFQAGVSNFTTGLAAGLQGFQTSVVDVNQAIANVSASLALNCADAHNVGASLVGLAPRSGSAAGGLAAVNQGISTWCQDPPNNIPSAIASIAAIAQAGRAAYKAAKAGN